MQLTSERGQVPAAGKFSLAALILAAGASQRMGRPKLLLPWGNSSILGHLIRTWRELPTDQVAVVCAAGDLSLELELERLGFDRAGRIINPEPARGMFSSIQCGAAWQGWTSLPTHWAIVLGDQPQLDPGTLRRLAARAADYPEAICQPASQGRPSHPVLLPQAEFRRLADSRAHTLANFLQSSTAERVLMPVDDPAFDWDIDVPADYEKARSRFAPGGSSTL